MSRKEDSRGNLGSGRGKESESWWPQHVSESIWKLPTPFSLLGVIPAILLGTGLKKTIGQ